MSKLMLAFTAATAVALFAAFGQHNGAAHEAQHALFKVWMLKHGKTYSTEEEYRLRLAKFAANVRFVADHNARYVVGLETFDVEMNGFADLDSAEFKEKYLMKEFKITKNCTGSQPSPSSLPTAVDWSTKGAVTPIKNQGQCGSCWAFSTTGSVEGADAIKNNKLNSYSEQQLVDCSHAYGNNGCQGGLMDDAFGYIIDNGITLESTYGYTGVNGACKYTADKKALGLSNCADVTADKEIALQAAVAQQPVSVAIEANHASFQLYKSGVYSGNCGTSLDHGVLAVGYGSDAGKPFWKVKNSWGASWGMSGYIQIARTGDGKGKCGINMVASFPIL